MDCVQGDRQPWDAIPGQLGCGRVVSRSSWGHRAEADAMDPQAEGGAPRVCSLFAGVQLGIGS